MQINYNVTGTQRKEMVEIISSVVRVQPVYKFMPTCAYAISNITVDKDGVMIWDKRTDDATVKAVKAALAKAGFKPVTAKAENAKQPVKTAAAAITPAKTSKTVNADKKAEEKKAEKPSRGYTGKTSWGADWTLNPNDNILSISASKTDKEICICCIDDIFDEALPLTLAQRREACGLMEAGQKFAALRKDMNEVLGQLKYKFEDFSYESFLFCDEAMKKRAKDIAKKISDIRCELNSF